MHFPKRSDMATLNTQFYLQTDHTCLYSPAAKHHRPFGWYSFYRPTEGKRLSWPTCRWLVTYRNKVPPRKSNPDTVTHPSTNRAQRMLTSLIETNALPLRQQISWEISSSVGPPVPSPASSDPALLAPTSRRSVCYPAARAGLSAVEPDDVCRIYAFGQFVVSQIVDNFTDSLCRPLTTDCTERHSHIQKITTSTTVYATDNTIPMKLTGN